MPDLKLQAFIHLIPNTSLIHGYDGDQSVQSEMQFVPLITCTPKQVHQVTIADDSKDESIVGDGLSPFAPPFNDEDLDKVHMSTPVTIKE